MVYYFSTNHVEAPPQAAFPVASNAYALYLKVYYSEGHEEFVKIFEESCKSLLKSPPQQKFDFLLLVLLYCNLDAGNWLFFCWEIQKNNNSFWKQLCIFINADDFKKLPNDKQREIKDLVDSFKANEHHFDVSN